ncbi:TIGR02530 family flagellar biosynthesis protein [Longirhabdus pacifica]|uniref:TIGR02530 family flagellar biosynthesis protein n=1 Tax=Longirhabdus pacifica TaxID=2305227 RepID=UPI001008D1CF|nr:TIGR02530 family flagellar biosynthesis protein [Longirhabdus pacifica]
MVKVNHTLYTGKPLHLTQQPVKPNHAKTSDAQTSFQHILEQKQLKFSAHASMRLEERNIALSQEQLQRLDKGMVKAEAKGAKDTLIMMDQFAFITNVKNKTIVTAMDQQLLKDHVFTKIDSTIIV